MNILWYILIFAHINHIISWNWGQAHKEKEDTEEDYYKILGINRNSTQKQIRRAYLELSKKFHPDVYKEDNGEKFRDIAKAYEILNDPEKRQIYDKYGAEGLENYQSPGEYHESGDFDIFSQFFGGFARQHEYNKSESMAYPVRLDLSQLYEGTKFEVEVTRPVLCKFYKECVRPRKDCQGPGVRVIVQQMGPGMIVQQQIRDPNCIAYGQEWNPRCKACPNGQTTNETIVLEVDVKPGTPNGYRIVFEGKGKESPGMEPGDVVITIYENEDKRLKREGDDLVYKLNIPLKDALLGFKVQLPHFRKEPFTFEQKRGEITSDGQVFVINNMGMPLFKKTSRYGRYLVNVSVTYPKKLTGRQLDLIAEAFA